MDDPRILFGASSIGEGEFSDFREASDLFAWLQEHGVSHFDTAALYPLSSPGRSEAYLGEHQKDNRITIDTKIQVTDFSGRGSLDQENIDRSVNGSKSRMTKGINVLYCHMPDPQTPIETSLKILNKHFIEQNFQQV